MRRANEPKTKSLSLSHPVEERNVSRGLPLSSDLSPTLHLGESTKKRPAKLFATGEQFRLLRPSGAEWNPLCPAIDCFTQKVRGEQGDILISDEVLKALGFLWQFNCGN